MQAVFLREYSPSIPERIAYEVYKEILFCDTIQNTLGHLAYTSIMRICICQGWLQSPAASISIFSWCSSKLELISWMSSPKLYVGKICKFSFSCDCEIKKKSLYNLTMADFFFLLVGARVNFWGQTWRAKYTSKLQLLCTFLPIPRSYKPNLTCWLNQVYSCFALLEWSRADGTCHWIRVIFFLCWGLCSFVESYMQ